jgi:hypothetical protein
VGQQAPLAHTMTELGVNAGVVVALSLALGQQIVQVGGGELPLERLCRGVVAVFECSEPVPDLVQVGEVVGRDDLALHDGEEGSPLRGIEVSVLPPVCQRYGMGY